eukprot:3099907-Rhodomonas_salina.1
MGTFPFLLLACCLVVASGFTANSNKINTKLSDFEGKTAWVRDLDTEVVGAFTGVMCVDYESGALIEAVYDNPGIVRVNPTLSSRVSASQTLVLPEVPYASAVVCDGSGVAYIAGSSLNSSVIAVSLSRTGTSVRRLSAAMAVPVACGGVLMMKYSSSLNLL